MAAARTRQTFRYPDDNSDDEDLHPGMDEEEQEKLIEELKEEDAKKTRLYKTIFIALPVLSALAFLPFLFTSPSIRLRLISLFCITNLSTTAWLLAASPDAKHDEHGQGPPPAAFSFLQDQPRSQWIGYANSILSALLSLNAYTLKGKAGLPHNFWLLCVLPTVCSILSMLFERIIVSVDIGELEQLRYRYKGA